MINSFNKEQLKVDKIKNKDSERVHIASLSDNKILIVVENAGLAFSKILNYIKQGKYSFNVCIGIMREKIRTTIPRID